jgi:predicted aspartyl protease
MTFGFDPSQGLIIVPVRLFGPAGDMIVRLALDTGATSTLINSEIMVLLGYDPATSRHRIHVTTGSGVELCPRVIVQRLEALGKSVNDFPVLSHTLPPTSQVDGLLGLDFFRGFQISIDFRSGTITIT